MREEPGARAVAAPQVHHPSIEQGDIVIVGNGIAGLTAAIEARRLAPQKRIVVFTDQAYPTILAPALKQYASGKLEPEQLLAFPPGIERTNNIYVAHEYVEQIDPQAQAIGLQGDRWFGYGSLVLATGSRPNGPPDDLPGRSIDGVLTLHRLEDYRELRRRIAGGVRQAVVVGGGVHAAETVMTLRSWDVQVHWLLRSERFLSNTLDQEASMMVIKHMHNLGVHVETQTEVAGVVGKLGTVAAVLTSTHRLLPCQLVCFCTGTRANTSLAEACTGLITFAKGVVVDDLLRTSVSHISAIGDVAALKNPQTGALESRALWFSAVLQARMVAAVLTGNAQSIPAFGANWQATRIGDLAMLSVGDPLYESELREILVDTTSGYRRVAFEQNRMVGYLSLGYTHPDGLSIKRIIDEALPIAEIKRDLLRPDFDARAYLAVRKSREVFPMRQSISEPRVAPTTESRITTTTEPRAVPTATPRVTPTTEPHIASTPTPEQYVLG